MMKWTKKYSEHAFANVLLTWGTGLFALGLFVYGMAKVTHGDVVNGLAYVSYGFVNTVASGLSRMTSEMKHDRVVTEQELEHINQEMNERVMEFRQMIMGRMMGGGPIQPPSKLN